MARWKGSSPLGSGSTGEGGLWALVDPFSPWGVGLVDTVVLTGGYECSTWSRRFDRCWPLMWGDICWSVLKCVLFSIWGGVGFLSEVL